MCVKHVRRFTSAVDLQQLCVRSDIKDTALALKAMKFKVCFSPPTQVALRLVKSLTLVIQSNKYIFNLKTNDAHFGCQRVRGFLSIHHSLPPI